MILTPAQIDFLKSEIPDFTLNSWTVELAGRAASQRYFVRVSNGAQSYVLIVWDSRDEDWDRFLSMQRDLQSRIAFLPNIYQNDKRQGLILEEDLGAVTLKKFCIENSSNLPMIESTYKNALDALWEWQQLELSVSQAISARAMDYDTFLWESGYFARFCVTDFCAREKLLNGNWEKERERLALAASSISRTCIHRDFQSENVMIHNGNIRFVDYQGARLGPPQYDTASLLFDPYIEMLTPELIKTLYVYYQEISTINDDHSFYLCAAQRLMQALGAYGNLSLHKGKTWYKDYIPCALDRLVMVLRCLPEYEHIGIVADECRSYLQKIEKKDGKRCSEGFEFAPNRL